MNERIEQLATQAGLYDEKSPEEVPGFTACFEKFAELIVKECQHRVEEYIGNCGEIGSLPDSVIKEHFGVE